MREPALADPGLAVDREEVRALVAQGALVGVHQELELGVTPDERCLLCMRPRAAPVRTGGSPGPDLPVEAFQVDGADVLDLDPPESQAVRGRPDQELPRLGGLLESRRQRDCLTGGEGRLAVVRDDLPGLDPGPGLELELVDRVHDREPRAHGALGVVLVGLRDAEGRHDRVTGEFLHDPAVGDHAVRDALEEGLDTAAHDLGIGPRDQAGRIRRGPRTGPWRVCVPCLHCRNDRRSPILPPRVASGACSIPRFSRPTTCAGSTPSELDEDGAYAIGRAFVDVFETKRIAVGHDMRVTSPSMAEAVIRGASEAGADVLELGLVGTEMVYFAVGELGLDGGVAVTASHNPKEYTGLKIVRGGALPVGGESGLLEIRDRAMALSDTSQGLTPGHVERYDIWEQYVERVLSFVDLEAIKPLKIVVDAANGMAGVMLPPVLERLPQVEAVRCFFEPDGTFPNHAPNPLLPENREFIVRKTLEEAADFGAAFDGDADRCFFVDDSGEFVPGDFVTALFSELVLEKEPGAKIIYDVRASWAVPETIERAGGIPLMNRVGHAYHQAPHARRGCSLRRRGLRPLLLPRLLAGRFRRRPLPAHARARLEAGPEALGDPPTLPRDATSSPAS